MRQAAAYREAAANARRALALDPRTGLAYYALAMAMPGIANWQLRVDTIAAGLKVEPDGAELNSAMAEELQRVGRSREAITYFRRSMASDPLGPVKTAAYSRRSPWTVSCGRGRANGRQGVTALAPKFGDLADGVFHRTVAW